jgi:hypothetical protein
MQPTIPRREPDALARLAAQVLDKIIRPALRPEDDGKFLAIDVDSGAYELDADDYSAVKRLRARRPTAEIWLERVGEPAAYRLRASR